MNPTYTIGFSKSPSGLINDKFKHQQIIDPAVGPTEIKVIDCLKHLQREFDYKFRNTSEIFRQFQMQQNSFVSFRDFCFIIDQMCVRFSKKVLQDMFKYLD